jgi:uncharacterized damage-inducible protein DinB
MARTRTEPGGTPDRHQTAEDKDAMAAQYDMAERDAARIEALVDELLRVLAAAADDHWTRPHGPDEWTAAEVCGHIAEMLPYWAARAKEVAATPGTGFGRGLEDAGRLAGPAEGGRLDRHQTVERLRHATTEACTMIRTLPDEAFAIEGTSAGRGPMTIRQMLDDLVIDHLESHVEQVRRAVG